jgi:indolepyruvate ferredoxin oxidoreductase
MNTLQQKPQNARSNQTTLAETFTMNKGFAFMSGTQALARLPLLQRQRDLDAGLDTRGFISGYRGSPLAGYDIILGRAKHLLDAHQITFVPGINEELAATAIIGTQQVTFQADTNCAGVFSLWYGKGPGLDRAGDALKHANSMGSTPYGGALVVVGDDHNAISSAMAHQSEQLFASWMMPVLHASSIYERVIADICTSLSSKNLDTATEIAALALSIRGYGHVKERNVEIAGKQLEKLLSRIQHGL